MQRLEEINATTYRVKIGQDEVEIGDIKAAKFKPHIKLKRWGDECYLGVSLPTLKRRVPIVDGSKIKWISDKLEAHFYSLMPRITYAKGKDDNNVEFKQNELGGFEFEIILKEKPAINKIALNIETQGLKFSYQPPLTQGELEEGPTVRPDNVAGSYAVYHATRTNMHRSTAEANKYKAGKAFHIYRPKVRDAQGNEIWADLHIDERKGTLTITIDRNWLHEAIYPVTIDPNFGYETIGQSSFTDYINEMYGNLYATPADIVTADSITMYVGGYLSSLKGLIVATDLTIITNGITDGAIYLSTPAWRTATFATPPSPSPSTNYYLAGINGDTIDRYYDADGPQRFYDNTNSYASPTNPTDGSVGGSIYLSIFCTYSAAAGWTGKISGVTNPAKIMGVAVANISKVKGVS